MALTINISGDLRLDQTAGLQSGGTPDKDDIALTSDLSALPDPFETFLESLTSPLTAAQLSNATTYGGANEDPGAGYMVTVSGTGATDLFFSQANGMLFNGQVATYNGQNLTVAGSTAPIYLYSFMGGDILIGSTEAPADVDITDPSSLDGSKLVFAYYLQENDTHTGADIWGVTFQPIEHVVDGSSAAAYDDTVDLGDFLNVSVTGSASFDFDILRSGKFLWVALGTESAGLLMTGRDLNVQDNGAKAGERVSGTTDSSDAVNTSQGGTGATTGINNQMYTPGDVGVLTFVKGLVPLPDSGTSGEASGDNINQVDYSGYVNVSTAGVFISQTQGGGTASMTIGLYEAGGGTTPEEGFGYIGTEGGNNGTSGAFDDDAKIGMHTVKVTFGNTTLTWTDGTASDGTTQGGITVTITGHEASISGLAANMEVFVTADSGETFNRLQVSANSGSTPFDIGRVDLTEAIGDTKNLGDSVFIHDDGPAIDLTPTATMIAVDESLGTAGSTKDEPGAAANNDETAAGAPAGAIGYAVTAAATLFSETVAAGTDGQASKVYALVLNAGATGLTDTVSGQAVVLSLTAGGVVEGRTATSNLLVFTIAVNGSTGEVTTTQYRALNHGADSNNHDSSKSMASGLVELQATLTDGDTDTAADKIELGSRIGFEDDGPALTVEDATGTFAAGAQDVTWDHDPGSDTFASLSLTLNSYKIGTGSLVTVDTSLGTKTATDANGNYVFTGSIFADFTPTDGLDDPQTVNFTLTFDPDNPETYTVSVTTPPSTVILRDTSLGELKAGKPDAVQTLLFGGDPPTEAGSDDVVFFGELATAPKSGVAGSTPPNDLLDLIGLGATDLTEGQIEGFLFPTNQIPTLINSATQMNVSTSGIGINNNNLDGVGTGIQAGDESFVFNPEETAVFVRVYIDNAVGGYTPASEELYYTVYYTDGSVSANILVTAGMLQDALRSDPTVPRAAVGGKYFEIDAPDTKEIDAVQLTMGLGTVKIPDIQWAIEQTFEPEDLQLNLTATLYDGDGDSATDTFSVTLTNDTII